MVERFSVGVECFSVMVEYFSVMVEYFNVVVEKNVSVLWGNISVLWNISMLWWNVSGPPPGPCPAAGDELLHRSGHTDSPRRLHRTLQGSSLPRGEVAAYPVNTWLMSASLVGGKWPYTQ